MSKFSFIALIVTGILLSGCGSKNMTRSVFDINNEYQIKGRLNPWSINQTKLLNIHALSPINEVGEIYFLYPSRGIESAFPLLHDQLQGVRLYKKVMKYEEKNASLNDLHNIKTSILALDQITLDLAKKQVDYITAQARYDINATAENNATLRQVKQELTTLEHENNATYRKFLSDLNGTQGLLVAQWSEKGNSAQSASLGEGDNFQISSQQSKSKNGFILASGITIESVYLDNKNSKQIAQHIDNSLFDRMGMVTYMVSADNFLFVNRADHSQFINMVLQGGFKDSQKILTNFSNLEKIKLVFSLEKFNQVNSSGQYKKPTISYCEKTFKGQEVSGWTKKSKAYNDIACQQSGVPFFAIFTEIDKLNKLYKE
jgi:hypothetical protein